ncbi:MAG TPA: hypothetical protein VL326_06880 [Kofleriaceae bacterium]|nr:hypothetical protein [Kofleriaceae bacterium]
MRGLATLALLLVPTLALAQSAKDKQKAGELVKQAIAKSQAGDHQAAVDLYQEAYKLIPQPLLLSNIGSEYQQMDHKEVESLGWFCKYLASEGPQGQNSAYVTAQAKLLYIRLGGVTDVKDEDVCKPIVKPAPVTPVDTGNTNTNTTPTEPVGPAPGPVDNGPKTKTPPMRYVGMGLAVVGAGMFGFGVYEGLQAKSISDEITNHPMGDPWDSNIKDREAEGESAEKKQIIFMAAGGVALVAGVAMVFVFKPKTESAEQHVMVTPVVNGDTLGFAAAGRF